MIFVLYFVVGSHLGSLDLYFVVHLEPFSWMDLYSVDPFSLQNHLSAPSPEMSKGISVPHSFPYLGLSENSVALNPMVNDHYPY